MLKNKLIILVLAISLVFSVFALSGCVTSQVPGSTGSSSQEQGSSEHSEDSSSSEDSASSSESSSEDSSSNEDPVTVTVIFLNHDGTELYSVEIEEGSVPSYKGATPTKASTPATEYQFAGWELNGVVYTSLPAVSADTGFTASYTEAARKYTVTFIVNGEESSKVYEYGVMPSYEGETRFEIDGEVFVLSGWDKPITAVEGDCTYTANLVSRGPVKYYDVTFVVDESSIVVAVKENTVPVFYGEPYRKEKAECSYRFIGWKNGDAVYEELPVVTENVTYTALFETVYKQFTVTFKHEGEPVQTVSVQYGQAPVYTGVNLTKQSDSKYDYSLAGWIRYGEVYYGELPHVYEDMAFEAVFEKTLRVYNVTVNYYLNGTIFDSYSQNYTCGDDCEIASPAVSGYSPSFAYVSGCVVEDRTVDVYYSSYDVWNGGSESVTAQGEGTQDSPYIITTAEQLAQLAKDVDGGNAYENVYFKLNNDLDLANIAWEAIGHYDYPFGGHFDGNGHLIYNLSYRSEIANSNANSGHGLFSTVSGSVKNLNVSGSVYSVAKYTALVVGHNKGGLVQNCNSFGTVCGFGNTAGIVGWSSGEIKNCNNYATITQTGASGTYRTAGIVGGTNASVSYCNNYGQVIVDGGSGTVAGIVARKEGSAVISYCNNYGYVSSTKNYVGGVIGYALGQSDSIKSCNNYAPVYGAAYTSGVVGYNEETAIESCSNYGLVKGSSNVGGIVGYTKDNVTNCENVGYIYGTSNYVGGVVGRAYANVHNCVNKGDVLADNSSAGGVIGYFYANKDLAEVNGVKNCVNFGSITVTVSGSNANAGGVIGVAAKVDGDNGDYVKPYVEECVNHGLVLSNASYTGGVLGGCNGALVKNCVNHANVISESGSYVAGIAGSNWGYGSVSSCTNYGAILGGATVGEICGQLTSTSTAVGNLSLGKLL